VLSERFGDSDSPREPGDECSVITLERERVHAAAKRDLEDFFFSRHSIRQFAPGAVEQSLIEHAAYLAQRTPSVCNRQAWRIHVLDDLLMREKALQLQGGNRGFGAEADKALIVTCQVGHYLKIGERNQAWVDGGMFAMSLVYALHSLGLGTCCLNWGKDRVEDRRAHKILGIPDDEIIIMFMLVGHLPERFAVAASARKDLGEMIVVHSDRGQD
jgi:nitroreductase